MAIIKYFPLNAKEEKKSDSRTTYRFSPLFAIFWVLTFTSLLTLLTTYKIHSDCYCVVFQKERIKNKTLFKTNLIVYFSFFFCNFSFQQHVEFADTRKYFILHHQGNDIYRHKQKLLKKPHRTWFWLIFFMEKYLSKYWMSRCYIAIWH